MIATIKPFGAIGERFIQFKYEDNGKFYIIDNLFNRIEIGKKDYDNLNCPVNKPKEARRV